MDVKFIYDDSSKILYDKEGNEKGKLSVAEGRLLVFFVNHIGAAQTRDDLVKAGWPKIIVVENALTMAIRKLRNFGITIKTIRGEGYLYSCEEVWLKNINQYLSEEGHQHFVFKEKIEEKDADQTKELNEAVRSDTENKLIEPGTSKLDSSKEKNINVVSSLFNRSQITYFRVVLMAYGAILCLSYLAIQVSEPNVKCLRFNNQSVEVCSVLSFNKSEAKKLTPGLYLYGYIYDENSKHEFIKVR
ncbi:hypothetical protein BS333_13715 [Vibrio azureus]|uniref:OmpR/PhoB-type domain-containing protein n=1 Tax=Vibrio azureus NBRC 104587 TaxID=1219077 RepID=U3AU63_9VIBR|nr:winged helix-turn-helix domain-containing protein [Vibrio azureus]AUI87475.1 hypothetical protein BS333_13715 [Vibrio azureus]GAD77285.1 hypothetical protein VAZ01S_069_00330 [Vibrio azureus NBRC 104587]